MNRVDRQLLRLNQLTDQLHPDQTLRAVQRPVGGWLRAVRQALGLSLKSVAQLMKISPQAIHQFEKSEAKGSISLRQLESVAGAMGCKVVYTLIPRQGTLAALGSSSGDQAHRAVRHSMALEGQAVDSRDRPDRPGA